MQKKNYITPTNPDILVDKQREESIFGQQQNVDVNRLNEQNPFMSTIYGPEGNVSRSLSDPLQGSLSGIYGGFGNALGGYSQLANQQPGQFSRDVEQGILSDMMTGLDSDEAQARQNLDARNAAFGRAEGGAAASRGQQNLEDQLARNRANMRLAARGQAASEFQQGIQNQMQGLAGLGGLTGGTIGGALGSSMGGIPYAQANYATPNAIQAGQNYDQSQAQRWRDINTAQNQQYAQQMNAYNQQQQESGDWWNDLGTMGLGAAKLGMTAIPGGSAVGGLMSLGGW